MHISVLWKLPWNSIHLIHVTPQLLKRFLEFFKNYFLSQFMSFTRKSVLLLYNYTLFFFLKLYYPAWSPPDLPLLALNWLGCFQKSKPLSKNEDVPLLKMCLRLWRQFPKRGPTPRCPPPPPPHESSSPLSQKHPRDAAAGGPLTSSTPKISVKGVFILGWPRPDLARPAAAGLREACRCLELVTTLPFP